MDRIAQAVFKAEHVIRSIQHCDRSRNAPLTFCLGVFPDRYQRQNRGKSHEQTNCSPLSIWILHILLLGTH